MSLLRVQNLSISFGGLKALSGLNMEVDAGEIRGLIGPNGSGKTTFFNVLAGFYRPDSGVVLWQGREIQGRPSHVIAASGIARTFQNLELFGDLTVLDNVLVAMEGQWERNLFLHVIGAAPARREERRARQRALELLEMVGLEGWENVVARNLPFGHQRLLEMARALAAKPRLLLLDEPSAGMNPPEVVALGELVRAIRDRFDLTIILVAHTMQLVMGISDRITVLDHGEKIADGTGEEIRRDPRVIEAYLGVDEVSA